jgi:hypothetical protein
MTIATPSQPLTATGFLFGETRDSVDTLADALEGQRVLGSLGLKTLSRSSQMAADRELATVVRNLLDIDLGEIVVEGWGKYAALTATAKRTIAVPDSAEVVAVATHRITSTHRPSVSEPHRSDAVALFDWLMSVDLDALPITHPAEKQALADLLTRLEHETYIPVRRRSA